MTVAKRQTWQKDAVRHALGETKGFLSAQELHSVLRNHGSTIGLATVYRALADLADSGEADSIQAAGGEALFRACGQHHHHHLMCRECGKTVEIAAEKKIERGMRRRTVTWIGLDAVGQVQE